MSSVKSSEMFIQNKTGDEEIGEQKRQLVHHDGGVDHGDSQFFEADKKAAFRNGLKWGLSAMFLLFSIVLIIVVVLVAKGSKSDDDDHNDTTLHAPKLLTEPEFKYPADGVDRTLFPTYHVRPQQNWMNDPNGPYWDANTGLQHLWMQYNPHNSIWGNMSWWHCVSKDLVKWYPLGVSLTNDKPYDKAGVFSGSMVYTNDRSHPVILYTCVSEAGGVKRGQRQCSAIPKDPQDPLLKEWVKTESNPIVPDFPTGLVDGQFRDPTSGYVLYNDQLRMLVGAEYKSSKDAPPLAAALSYATANASRQVGYNLMNALFYDPSAPTKMFECPDLFLLDEVTSLEKSNWILKWSNMANRRDYYRLGTYSADTNIYTSMSETDKTKNVGTDASDADVRMLDAGEYYASKTYNSGEHRILWGWIDESVTRSPSDLLRQKFAGAQAIPRVVTYERDLKQMRTAPVAGMKKLRIHSAQLGALSQTSMDSQPLSLYSAWKKKEVVADPFSFEMEASLTFSSALLNPHEDKGNGKSLKLVIFSGDQANNRTFTVALSVIGGSGTVHRNVLDDASVGKTYAFYDLPSGQSNSTLEKKCMNTCQAFPACVSWNVDFEKLKCNLRDLYTGGGKVMKEGKAENDSKNRLSAGGVAAAIILSTEFESFASENDGDEVVLSRSKRVYQRRVQNMVSPSEGLVRVDYRLFFDHTIVEVFKDEGLDVIGTRSYDPIPFNNATVSVLVEDGSRGDDSNKPNGDAFYKSGGVALFNIHTMDNVWMDSPPKVTGA